MREPCSSTLFDPRERPTDARAARHHGLHRGPRAPGRRPDARGRAASTAPFLLRTFDPPLEAVEGKTVRELRRLGKRIVFGLDDDLWLVLHLMIAGRLHWKPQGAKLSGKLSLAAFDFPTGTLLLTEAGTKRRASLHLRPRRSRAGRTRPGRPRSARRRRSTQFRGRARAAEPHAQAVPHRPAPLQRHRQRLLRRDPPPRAALAAGPDAEARPSDDVARLFDATREVLIEWIDRLREPRPATASPRRSPRSAPRWPSTAATASHARSAAPPCSASATPTTRPTTAPAARPAGKLLADRSLSRLLKDDWPRNLDEL